jgi:spore maturation protein CgeB
MKSDLKFLECAAEQVAVLASPTVYEKTAVDGESALIFRSPEEFGRKFDELVTSLSLRVKLTENARRYVAGQRMLAQHIHKRVDWYRQLLGRLDELDREVRERCPELWDPAAADIPWKAPD